MKFLSRIARIPFVALAALALSLSSTASHATSASDVWWVPTESGWGINVLQQGSALGFAMFVYDDTRTPFWYLGSGTGNIATGFAGQMIAFQGPYFGGAFNPATVTSAPAGVFNFTLTAVNSANFSYTIGGVTVSKTMVRQSVANDDIRGNFYGALLSQTFNCSTSSFNSINSDVAQFAVTQTGTNAAITVTFSNAATCTFTGTYAQQGRYGSIDGTFTCPGYGQGNFNMFEIDSNSQGLTARYTATATYNGVSCQERGRMGGLSTDTTNF